MHCDKYMVGIKKMYFSFALLCFPLNGEFENLKRRDFVNLLISILVDDDKNGNHDQCKDDNEDD